MQLMAMETKFEHRQHQGQIPSSFPETFKDFFSMLNEDEDHVELISNILEDKIIPRSTKCRYRCGGNSNSVRSGGTINTRCCHTSTSSGVGTGCGGGGSGGVGSGSGGGGVSGGGSGGTRTGGSIGMQTNFGRSSSFRVARPNTKSEYCKHMKYCCLHQKNQYLHNQSDFSFSNNCSDDEKHMKKFSKLYGTSSSVGIMESSKRFFYESCDETETVSSSCSSSNTTPVYCVVRHNNNKGGATVGGVGSGGGGLYRRGSITRTSGVIGVVSSGSSNLGGSSGIGGTSSSTYSDGIINNPVSSTSGTGSTLVSGGGNGVGSGSGTGGGNLGGPSSSASVGILNTKSLSDKISCTYKQDIKTQQKSPIFNRRRSSSITTAQPSSDLHRFLKVDDPTWSLGITPETSIPLRDRHSYCKSPVNSCGGNTLTRTTEGPNRSTKQKQRMRTASMPAENRKPRLAEMRRSAIHCADMDIEYYRLRSFSITSHGICNLGDSMRSRRSRSINSVTSTGTSNSGRDRNNSNASQTTQNELSMETTEHPHGAGSGSGSGSIPAYKVAMLGASGVGKTALTYQFTTSEYICAYDLSLDDDYGQKTVSVLLDGQETDLEIIDHPACEMSTEAFCSTYNIDIFVVVYSVVDRKTLKAAEKVLHYLRDNEMMLTRGVILVGNKTDLERHREVQTQAGRRLAKEVNCKFIETSSGLDHNVDELLVGIVAQVKLNPQRIHNLTEKQRQGLTQQAAAKNHHHHHHHHHHNSSQSKTTLDHSKRGIRTRQGGHSEGPINSIDLNVLKSTMATNKENILKKKSTTVTTSSAVGICEEDEDNKSSSSSRNSRSLSTSSSKSSSSSSSSTTSLDNDVNLLHHGSPSCSSALASTKKRNSYDSHQQQSPKKTNQSVKDEKSSSSSTKFSNRTKLFLTSFLKFKKTLRVKRRNSNSCSDLFVI